MKKQVQSWMGVHKRQSEVFYAENESELLDILDVHPEARISGTFHSYNRVALHEKTIILGSGFDNYRMYPDGTCHVGAASKIKNVMLYLLTQGKRLLNSGNHREQTLVGAALTGTHGFGRDASLIQSVKSAKVIRPGEGLMRVTGNRISPLDHVLSVRIFVRDLVQYEVKSCACRLSQVSEIRPETVVDLATVGRAQQEGSSRAYIVLPYSDEDPVCVINDYVELVPKEQSRSLVNGRTKKAVSQSKAQFKEAKKAGVPFLLRLFWAIDGWCPMLRKYAQKLIAGLDIKPWSMITDPEDIDVLYHPWPGLDGDTFRWMLWAYKPTYTSHNICAFVPPENTKDLIGVVKYLAECKKPGLLRNFIGVRELTNTSSSPIAGNYKEVRNAVDFYCSPRDADDLIEVLTETDRQYPELRIRWHRAKSP